MPSKSEIDRRELSTRDHPLVVHSHLRWDFVWQRPQQLLSRLARTAPVLFVEEPVHLDDVSTNRLELTMPSTNVIRAVPRLTGVLRGDYDASIAAVRDLVLGEISSAGSLDGLFKDAVQWFYTPMPAPAMLGAINESGVVYDCMDELAQFRHAPPDLVRRERLLIANADVVFTGGYRLFKAKSALHRNVHFFGCGVDVAHFGSARDRATVIPADAVFPSPVAGYFGVIDERLDYDLIRALAERHPEVTVLMVGPTVKVNPDELPQAPNIHWLGQKSYDELPRYVKTFDVCMMPFALNEATEYINPTKTLEYMAAGKPIVSTAVADVVRNFTPVVTISRDIDEFVRAVMNATREPDESLLREGIRMAEASSWESIVSQMRNIISNAVDQPELFNRIAAAQPVAGVAEAEIPGA
ncbi:MAG TPA: glycosyltransferase [Gemmatimonadaceae bacterium]|nr:glycosyltransferase [Gemmatimonadaceae bacterium]